MNNLFDCLDSLAKEELGVVVHLGAGHGSVLACYERLTLERAVLIEGDPDTFAELRRRSRPYSWAEVHAGPVTSQDGPVEWRRYSVPAFNGPVDAGSLETYFPRLQLRETIDRDSVGFASMLKRLDLQRHAGRTDVLVLDVPGQEGELLSSWPPAWRSAFEVVVLRGCREALAPKGLAFDDVIREFESQCFQVVSSNAESKPLWPVAVLRLDVMQYRQREKASEQQRCIGEFESAVQVRDRRVAELEASNFRLSASADASARLAGDRLHELEAALGRRDEALQLAESMQRRVQQVTDAQAAHAEEAEAAAALLRADTARQVIEADERTRSAEARLQTVGDALTERQSLHDQLAERLKQAEADAALRVKELERQLSEARTAMEVAVKLQMLRDADLRELQSRYQDNRGKLRRQHDLLGELAQRLGTANHYFHQLSQSVRFPAVSEGQRFDADRREHPGLAMAADLGQEDRRRGPPLPDPIAGAAGPKVPGP